MKGDDKYYNVIVHLSLHSHYFLSLSKGGGVAEQLERWICNSDFFFFLR